jgi:hypothetical protein
MSASRTPMSDAARDQGPHGEVAPALSETNIDETLAQTFPASDPPYWTLGIDPFLVPSTSRDEY